MLKFFYKIFVQFPIEFFVFCFFTAVNTIVYMAMSLFFAKIMSNNFDIKSSDIPGGMEFAFILVLTVYFASYLLPVFIQLKISNSFMVKLTTEFDLNTKVSAISAMPDYNFGNAIKDNTVEFPRFAANIIIPLLDIIKSTISILLLLIFLLIYSSNLIWIISIIPILYFLFWVISKSYFKRMALEISEHFYQRQRIASYRFQAFGTDLKSYAQSSTRLKYFSSLVRLGKINTYTKVVATLPRAVIESLVLLILYFLLVDSQNVTPLIMAIFGLLKLLPAIQSISNGVSQLQTNFPSYQAYQYRSSLLRSYGKASEEAAEINCPRSFISGETFSTKRGLTYSFKSYLNIGRPGLYLLSGDSGVGKSTFIRSLLGLENIYGNSFVAGNHDAALVSQNENLLEGTVLENLNEARTDFQTHDIYLQLVSCLFPELTDNAQKELINKVVGGNSGLSGGQLARIKLLKVLLMGKPIIFLDEVFEGVPKVLASKIMQELVQKFPNTCFILIDHNNIDPLIAHTLINFTHAGIPDMSIEITVESDRFDD